MRDYVNLIPLHEIEPDPNQPRKNIHNVSELADSMKSGLINPITVYFLQALSNEPAYRIETGHRRYAAAKLLGWYDIPAIVKVKPGEEEIRIRQLTENTQREDLNSIEQARAYSELRQRLGCTQEELAKKLGVKQATVSRYESLLTLSPTLTFMIQTGVLAATEAFELAKLEPGRQDELVYLLARQQFKVKLSDIVKTAKANPHTSLKSILDATLKHVPEAPKQKKETPPYQGVRKFTEWARKAKKDAEPSQSLLLALEVLKAVVDEWYGEVNSKVDKLF